MPDNHLLHCALNENIKNNTLWIKHIQKIVGHHSLKAVKESYKINSVIQLTRKLHMKITKEFKKTWKDQINSPNGRDGKESNKLRTYNLFKKEFKLEKYLCTIKNFNQRRCLAKLRLSDHNLEVELGRRMRPKKKLEDRICKKCKTNKIDDEMHFILNCSHFENERHILFRECGITQNDKNDKVLFIEIMKNNQIALSKYIKETIYKPNK